MTVRRSGLAAMFVRTILAYLLASIVLTAVFFEVGGGHADVPFTLFPGYLVVAPVLPVLVICSLGFGGSGTELVSLVAFVVTFVAVWLGAGALLRNARTSFTIDGEAGRR